MGKASLKDPALYETLRDKGLSRQKAARISNAVANPDLHPLEKGGRAAPYEDWTKEALYRRAQEIGVKGRSRLDKAGLIRALREG